MPSNAPTWEEVLRMMHEQGVDDPSLLEGLYGDSESWTPLPEFESLYEFSDCGRARNRKSGRILKTETRNGKECFNLVKSGIKHRRYMVELLNQTFPNPVRERYEALQPKIAASIQELPTDADSI